MAINLSKGQRISLTKDNEGLSKIQVGLGWDPIKEPQKKGLFGALKASSAPDMDCDASVFMLTDDKFVNKNDLVYFGNLKSACLSVV